MSDLKQIIENLSDKDKQDYGWSPNSTFWKIYKFNFIDSELAMKNSDFLKQFCVLQERLRIESNQLFNIFSPTSVEITSRALQIPLNKLNKQIEQRKKFILLFNQNNMTKKILSKFKILTNHFMFFKWSSQCYDYTKKPSGSIDNIFFQAASLFRNNMIAYVGEFQPFFDPSKKKQMHRERADIPYLIWELDNLFNNVHDFDQFEVWDIMKNNFYDFKKIYDKFIHSKEFSKLGDRFYKFSVCLKHIVVPIENEFDNLRQEEEELLFILTYILFAMYEILLNIIDPFSVVDVRLNAFRTNDPRGKGYDCF